MKKYNEIKSLGDSLLRLVAISTSDDDSGSSGLQNMVDILVVIRNREHALEVAVQQRGICKRTILFIMDAHPSRQQVSSISHTILFNPSFAPVTENMEEEYDGWLSLGQHRGKEKHCKEIFCRSCDKGHLIERDVYGLRAEVVQNEIEHLEGVVFLDKAHSTQTLGFHDELIKVSADQRRVC
jgi:peptide deformylase